jgi:hypothetical protein
LSPVTAGPPKAFDSGLTIPDFVACLSMGLRPVGLVQGFYCGQISGWSSYSAYPVHNYPCVCYETGPHTPGWVGKVDSLDNAWMSAHQTALKRMLEEAAGRGAHGVVGVSTEMSHPTNENSCEVHLYGTAVVVERSAAPRGVWSTQLAGHKLAKLVEIGFVPSSVVFVRCTAMLAEGCNMEYYGSGVCGTGYVIKPLQDAHELARSGAMRAAGQTAPHAFLYDVRMQVHEAERYRSTYITCALLGSMVSRARAARPVAPPVPTVNLAS